VSASRRLTQRDIAQLAGVSQATVSLVLNEAKSAQGRIPPETRERVLKAIRDTGYVADPIARSMVKGANRILGVFTYEPAFPIAQADFYTPFLMGIEEAAESLGYDLLLMTASARDNSGRKRIFGESGRLRLADGCLILGSQFDRDELAQLVAGDYPYVAVGRRDDAGGPVRYVGADYIAATKTLVDQALAKGHRQFAFIGTTGPAESIADRWHGFQSAIKGRAELVHVDAIENGDPARQLAEVQASSATVVFFAEVLEAVAFDTYARAQGVKIPSDLSIVVLGSGTRTHTLRLHRAFTCYAIPREEMGRQAAAMLVQTLLDPSQVPQVLLTCEIVAGETLAPPNAKKDSLK
jgi:DNA-binding LacI/PurR family transcriptional regulator